MEDILRPGVTVKVVQIKPISSTSNRSWNGHCVSVDVPPANCCVSFYSILQPCTLLQRPQAIRAEALPDELCSATAQRAIPVAVAAFHKLDDPESPLVDLPQDPLKIADRSSLIEFGRGEVGLLMTASSEGTPLLLPPEGPAGEVSEEDSEAQTLEGSSESPSDQSTALLAARMALTHILVGDGYVCNTRTASKDKEVFLIWAESSESVSVSPSLLLATAVLMARKEAAMFLRMATGFGFAQVGDYTASLFYLFKRRGHRLKCWECGVKKKAPCGKVDRNDLPWCCHRRLGEWLPRLIAFPGPHPKMVDFVGNGKCFLGLLPPRSAMEADNPLAAQINYQPRASDVVQLSDVLQQRPSHPRQTLRKALHRLAPTCRLLWCKTPWIVNTVEKIKAGKDVSAVSAHLWLEKTAFFKVPRSLQDETVEINGRAFEDLVEELLPDVEDAPILGGHNRQSKQPAQSNTPLEQSVTMPSNESLVDLARNEERVRSPKSEFVERRPARNASVEAGGLPPRKDNNNDNLFHQHPAVVRVAPCENNTDGSSSLASYHPRSGEWNDSATDYSGNEDRAWANTGQGRRRLNARAALRAAGHKDGCGLVEAPLSSAARRPSSGTSDTRFQSCLSAKTGFLGGLTGELMQQQKQNMGLTSCRPADPQSMATYHQSMLDMYKAMEERNQGPRAEVPVANKLPLPLQIVVNAHSIDFHSKGLDSSGTLPPFPRPLMELNQFGAQQNRIQRPQSDASCQISIKPRAGGPARRKADPDYVPERSESIWGSNPGSSTQRHGSDENIDASQVSNFRSSGRKPRTARLQFWSQGAMPSKKRASRDPTERVDVAHSSDLFQSPGRGNPRWASKRRRQSPISSTDEDGTRSPKRQSVSPVKNFGAMNSLLQAVQLVSNAD